MAKLLLEELVAAKLKDIRSMMIQDNRIERQHSIREVHSSPADNHLVL
jgi:hypothetical protein